MGSAQVTYDPEMRKSDHGRRLYCYWRRFHRCDAAPEFAEYPNFYKWAMANGYTVGARLFRHDENQPFSPDNCFWIPREEWIGMGRGDGPTMDHNLAWERKWDETVNRIRVHFGMEPIHSSEV